MKKKLQYLITEILLSVIIISPCLINKNIAQDLPTITNELGDTIQYEWPITDTSLFVNDEIIIKFKKNALFLDKLCYEYVGYPALTELQIVSEDEWYEEQKHEFMTEQFPIDSLIADSSLRESIKSFGGVYLTRITSANPCTDTLSVTRFGDTVTCDNFLWLLLKLNNDTSAVNASLMLTLLFQENLEIAEPNFNYGHFDIEPLDTYYKNDPDNIQKSLWPFYSDAEGAWNYQTGSSEIKVAIIDNGLDYQHCDLAGWKGESGKVIGVWNYVDNNEYVITNSDHGTPIAGIITAYTNGNDCNTNEYQGVAGISGGWKIDDNNWDKGCRLVGLKIDVSEDDDISVAKVVAAILDAASDYYISNEPENVQSSWGVHIMNCSWGYDEGVGYLPVMHNALNFAYEQGVSIVTSRGNYDDNSVQYPACFDPNWITSVGWHDNGNPEEDPPECYPQRNRHSEWGKYMDILAPGNYSIIYTTDYGYNQWVGFYMTSASAAHVSGAIALLRSEFLKTPHQSNPDNIIPEPEDYENMLKAAAQDLNYDPNNENEKEQTKIGYDNVSGWGQLKIGEIFYMLNDGYVLKHYAFVCEEPSEYPQSDYNVTIKKNGKRNDCEEGEYNVRRRVVSGSFNLGNDWIIDEDHDLFVWGRNGRTYKGGFNKGRPLYLTSYTEVTSGERGNGLIPGIFHNNSTIVEAITYQYELRDVETKTRIMDLPNNDDLKLYISVFGKPKSTSVNNDLINNGDSTIIYPNPSSNKVNFNLDLEHTCSPVIKIYNSLGNIVFEKNYHLMLPGSYEKSIYISRLPNGLYLLEIKQKSNYKKIKFIVLK